MYPPDLDLRAILVCVDYSDILAFTLPYNRHHFSEVLVVTTPWDYESQVYAQLNNCSWYATESFYDDGASFNKWKALEEGLDHICRHGWIVIMDADILWPKKILWQDFELEQGCIYTPMRRERWQLSLPVPLQEDEWHRYPLHGNTTEWAGWTQIFHAEDPVLGNPPWHEVNWKHAGGADSFFQRKWSKENKKRPPFEVLHLGECGRNWYGRTTNYLDGTTPIEKDHRLAQLAAMRVARKANRYHDDPFKDERIGNGD